MNPTIEMAGLSDVGQERDTNQDQFLVAEVSKSLDIRGSSLDEDSHGKLSSGSVGQLAVVADGMGGHQGGETASAIAINVVESFVLNALPWCFRHHGDENNNDFANDLRRSIILCQKKINKAAADEPSLRGMGTTITMAYLYWPKLYVVHAGDSRCYVRRGSTLTQVTTDHTVAQKLVEEGVLESDEVEKSPYNHVLWNAVGGGGDEQVRPQVVRTNLRQGDQVLLCSDGLTAHVSTETIDAVLSEDQSSAEICAELIKQANNGGGSDNITVAVMKVHNDGVILPDDTNASLETKQVTIDWDALADSINE